MTTFTHKLLVATAAALLTLVPVFGVHAQPNEPADAQEQSETKASVAKYENSPGFVPYNPDARLSEKAASVQSLYDYFFAVFLAEHCNFPLYSRDVENRLWDKLHERLETLFPDGRDNLIALNHVGRHKAPDTTDCSTLKVRLDQLKSATGFQSE
jgi:hypothetical protein